MYELKLEDTVSQYKYRWISLVNVRKSEAVLIVSEQFRYFNITYINRLNIGVV